MFDNLYFNKEVNLDGKGRIILPSVTELTSGSKLVIAQYEYYYGLYLLEHLNAITDRLQNESFSSKLSKGDRALILKQLNYIFNAAQGVVNVDSQRRISLPSQAIEKCDTGKVILQGRRNNIALFPSAEEYRLYQESDNFAPIIL